MNRIPLDELLLLESLPGFRELQPEEKQRISINEFEYSDYPCMFSASLTFEYCDEIGRKMKLKFELAGNRSEDHFFRHVMYEETGEEIEFPGFREAIDFCNQTERPEPDWQKMAKIVKSTKQ